MDLSIVAATFAVGRRAAELGASAFQLGLLGATWLGVYSIVAPFAGRLSDRVGRRAMAVTGALIAAGAAFTCAWTTNIPALCAITGTLGLGVGIFWPGTIAWVSGGLTGRALAHRMARFSVSWNIGMLSGYGLSGALFAIGPRLAFYLAAGALLLMALLLLLPARDTTSTPATNGAAPELPRIPAGRGFRKTAWLSNFSMLFAVGGTLALFPQLATTSGIPADQHGFLLLLHRVASLGMVLMLPFFHFWQTRLWPLWIVQAICALGVAAVGLADSALGWCVALMVCGAMLGYNYQASLLFTFEEMEGKGEGSGIHEAMLGFGAFFGPLFGGWVGNHYSMRTPYFFLAAVLIGFIVIEMGLVAWRRRATRGA
jgi:MFS family permease